MSKIKEATYENGVLKPVGFLSLKEHQRVRLFIEEISPVKSDILNLATKIYQGLSPEEIQEIEAIAFNRSNFSREGV